MQDYAIRIDKLSVAFAGKSVLQNVTASLPEGGCTVFVGPNGAGKTTLLLCLAGEQAYTGKVRFRGEKPRRMGLVPQGLKFDQQTPVTACEFLALGISRRPLWLGVGKQVRAKVCEALERVGLAGSMDRKLGDMSGGEMRRVLLASALVRKPELLLLDEPAAGVDLKGEQLFWEILEEARKELGLTVVMVSHNLPLAAHYATHVLLLGAGSCVSGPPRVVLTANNLMESFGVPIHLYPDQCAIPQHMCPTCGAFDAGVQGHKDLLPMEGRCGCTRGCCRG